MSNSNSEKVFEIRSLVGAPVEKENSKPGKTVFGYLPSWTKYESDLTIRYDLLTHLAIFSFEADSLGNLKSPQFPQWPWNDVLSDAAGNNVKVIMTITNFFEKQIHKIFGDAEIQRNLFDKIKTSVIQYGFGGVNVDFENIGDNEDGRSLFKNFMMLLRAELNSINTGLELSAALPANNLRNWDFDGIAEYCNYIFIMGYDYYGSWAQTTGPSAPLTGEYFYLQKDIDEYYKNIPADKLILGVPYYGNLWRTNSEEPYAKVIPFDEKNEDNSWQEIILYKDIVQKFSQYERIFDGKSQTPWFRYKENDTTWMQLWCDDSVSLALKYDWAIQKNLKGIGIWALGYEGNRSELWNLIQEKFLNTPVSEEDAAISNEFVLFQNYPNPFNPSTVIKYKIPVAGFVSLKVYDLLGSEIALLYSGFQNAGSYEFVFDKSKSSNSVLSSGVYFYVLTAGNYILTRKMILLK